MQKRMFWVEIVALLVLGLSPLVQAMPSGPGPGPGPERHQGRPAMQPPPAHQRVPFRGTDYFYRGGEWFRSHEGNLRRVTPPPGLRIGVLPPGAQEVWIGSMLYHLAAGTYYLWRADSRDFEVVSPPAPSYDVIAYPAKGQGDEQQARDRYECHRWAVGQTGFDPSAAGGAPEPSAGQRYRRALGACLEGRGYSVT